MFYLGPEDTSEDLELKSGTPRGGHEAGGRAPHPRGPLVAPPTYFFRLYILLYPENIQGSHEAGGRAPTLMGPTELHRPTSFTYIYS